MHIPDHDGTLVAPLTGDSGQQNLVRLLTWVEGMPLEHQGEIPEPIVHQIGEIQARLCQALTGFDHAAASHFMPWDTMNGLLQSRDLQAGYLPRELTRLCEPELVYLDQQALPAMHRLPGQVIHNDVHAGNVLCDDSNPPRVCGVIDFGDIVKRPLVVDLATSLSNIAEHNDDVGSAASALLSGFESHLPLPQEQRELLYDALCARSILTVMLMHFHARNSSQPEKYGEAFITHAAAGVRRVLSLGRDGFYRAIS